jgi:transcriptional regulator with XRE-family HTH domain
MQVPARTCNEFSLKLVSLSAMMEGWLERLNKAVLADGRAPRTISRAAGLGPNYLGELFNKGKVPSVDKLLKLCAELDVSATYILTGSAVSPESEEMLSILGALDGEQQATLLSLARQLRKASQ